jgi:hypothetical protein
VSSDALTDSVAIWYFVHGMVALPSTVASFAWPDQATHLKEGIASLAHLRSPRTERVTVPVGSGFELRAQGLANLGIVTARRHWGIGLA